VTKKKAYKIIAFLYPVLSYFKINLVGQLAAGDLIALLSFFDFKETKKLFAHVPDIKKISIAYSAFLLAQVISDLVNHSAFKDMLRGWANIGMAVLTTVFFINLFKKSPKYIIFFLLGFAFRYVILGGSSGKEYSTDTLFTLDNMGVFKFRIAPILNVLLLVLSWYLLQRSAGQYNNIIALFGLYGLFCLAMDFRSNGIFFIMSAFIAYYRQYIRSISFKKLIPYLLIFILAFQGMYMLYISKALQGEIGGKHTLEQLKMTNNPYNPINLLLVGRTEFFVGLKAALDKPILGHGSWARDINGYYTYMAFKLHGEEDKFSSLLISRNGQLIIPAHSIIAGAWMNAGIVGLFSMLYIFGLFVDRSLRLLRNKYVQRTAYYPILVFYLFNGVWVFFFSPLPEVKSTLAVIIAFMIATYQAAPKVEVTEDSEARQTVLV